MHIRISLATKFQLQLIILTFWIKFAQKGYFRSKTKNLNIIIEFCMFELVYVPNFSLKQEFWLFGPNLPKKGISSQKQKRQSHQWVLHIRISVGTKFEHKVTILIFWTKFAPKSHFHLKTKKENSIIELCIFELV